MAYTGPITINNQLGIFGGTPTSPVFLEGQIGAAGSLKVNGVVVIDVANTFSGGVILEANSTVLLGSNSGFGTGPVQVASGFGDTTIEATGGSRTVSNSFDLFNTVTFAGSEVVAITGNVRLNGKRTSK